MTAPDINAAPGTAVRAPTEPSRADGFRRFCALSWTLAVTDFKLRFYDSWLGYAWTLVRPFALFGVLYIVFVEVVNIGAGVRNFPAYLLLAMVLFGFFRNVVDGCLISLVGRENLLRKMHFPQLVIPASIVLQALFELGLTLIAVTVYLTLIGVYPGWGWFELIPIVFGLGLFATGLGLLFSVLYVRFRDIAPIWDVLGQMLFYATPILYVATQVPESFQRAYLANPLAALLTQMRHAVIDPSARTLVESIGGWERIVVPLGIIILTFALGAWAFKREAPRVAENL